MSALLTSLQRVPFDPKLRWYQTEALTAVIRELVINDLRSTLLVAATGTGKSVIFADLAVRWPGRVLLLAHRDELVFQAREHFIEATGGEWIDVEKAEHSAGLNTRLVVGSVQTLRSPARLNRFPSDHFSLIIIDEAHHATASSYRKILDHFAGAKVLGVTATPDRGDGEAMGQVFQSVAYVFDILDGLEQGYLVPLRGRRVELDEIDISEVGADSEDLIATQLDKALVKAVEGMVQKTLELEPDRKGVFFTPGIKTADLMTQRFNYFEPGSTFMLSSHTDPNERKILVRDFKAGKYKRLCNCAIATEGFDFDGISLIGQGRLTKSRSFYAQTIGRGTRPLKACGIDDLKGRGMANERRTAIDWSAKPDCMVLDFVGNTGKHKLVTVEDILGGKYTDAEIAAAKKKSSGGNVQQALAAARKEIADYAASIRATVKGREREVDLFHGAREDEPDEFAKPAGYKPITPGQFEALKKWGYDAADLENVGKAQASRMMDDAIEAKERGWASVRQIKKLREFTPVERNLSYARASAAMNYLSQKGWGRQPIDPKALQSILKYERQPGEEG